jgi:hydrogenase maturation protease
VPEAVTVIEESGEGTNLMEAWTGQDVVFLVDAVRSGATPGTVTRFDAVTDTVPTGYFHYSTHAFSVAEAVELSRSLDLLPQSLIVYGIEGEDFGSGEGLSPAVAASADDVAERVARILRALGVEFPLEAQPANE